MGFLCFAVAIYRFYGNFSLALRFLCLEKLYVYPLHHQWPQKISQTWVQPHCDPGRYSMFSAGNQRASHTSEQLHSNEKKATMPHKLKEGQNDISAKQLKNIMIAFIKLSVILTGTSSSTRKHCLGCTKTWATPVEEHAPTNELISDMSCGVYVRVVLQCTWLPFTALVRL